MTQVRIWHLWTQLGPSSLILPKLLTSQTWLHLQINHLATTLARSRYKITKSSGVQVMLHLALVYFPEYVCSLQNVGPFSKAVSLGPCSELLTAIPSAPTPRDAHIHSHIPKFNIRKHHFLKYLNKALDR